MNMVKEFKKFALRGNLVEMAIGFTVGAAFTTVAKSLVDDLIMPIVGLFSGGTDFSNRFIVMKAGAEIKPPYTSLHMAQDAGAVTLNYGLFVNNLLAFLLVSAVMFLVVRSFNRLEEKLEEEFGEDAASDAEPAQKKCRYCRMQIPYRASRCPSCTSDLEVDTDTAEQTAEHKLEPQL